MGNFLGYFVISHLREKLLYLHFYSNCKIWVTFIQTFRHTVCQRCEKNILVYAKVAKFRQIWSQSIPPRIGRCINLPGRNNFCQSFPWKENSQMKCRSLYLYIYPSLLSHLEVEICMTMIKGRFAFIFCSKKCPTFSIHFSSCLLLTMHHMSKYKRLICWIKCLIFGQVQNKPNKPLQTGHTEWTHSVFDIKPLDHEWTNFMWWISGKIIVKKWANPGLFFCLFSSFQHVTIYIQT